MAVMVGKGSAKQRWANSSLPPVPTSGKTMLAQQQFATSGKTTLAHQHKLLATLPSFAECYLGPDQRSEIIIVRYINISGTHNLREDRIITFNS